MVEHVAIMAARGDAEILQRKLEQLREAFVTANLDMFRMTSTRTEVQQAMATKSQEIDAQQQELSRLSAEGNLNPDVLTKKLTAVAAQAGKSASASDAEPVSRQSEGSNANQAL